MLKTERCRAVGAMSGTSLDGVDAAEIVTDGHEIFEFGPSAFLPYTDAQRAVLRGGLGKWPEEDVAQIAALIETAHVEVLAGFEAAELVGFHGQTLAHDPQGLQGAPRTHQAGDGAVLAQRLGKPVVWDFRSADVQLGGEGAPLAPFYHFALAKFLKSPRPVAFLNLGGVGNVTWVDPSHTAPEDPGALLAFDTGPANAPINDLMTARRGLSCDENGALAAAGQVDEEVIEAFLTAPYFFRMAPKSLDRDAFADLNRAVAHLDDADAAATLTAACAASVAVGLSQCPSSPDTVLVCGGGRLNPSLMRHIELRVGANSDRKAPPKVMAIDEVGLDGDMLEAQAFAFLAVRVAKGLPTSCPGTTGVMAAVGGGTLSQPS